MYTEEFEERGFPFREFLIKLILIILFILLLIWLFSKFIFPLMNKKDNKTSVLSENTQTLANNLEKMKQAGMTYYTESRLPKENGKSNTITLEEMIKSKIITPLKDESNQQYYQTKSYIKITKDNDDYVMKVYLKGKKKEDYVLVHVGHYSYCKTYICEKTTSEKNKTNQTPISKVPIDEVETTTKVNTTEQQEEIKKSEEKLPEKESTVTKEEQQKNFLYEYKRVQNPVFSEWSLWSNWEKTSCITKEKSCSNQDTSCLEELKRYDIQEQIGTYQPKEGGARKPLYGTVCYQSIRKRKLLLSGGTDIKWSTYQDSNLLNAGYHYTGNKKEQG